MLTATSNIPPEYFSESAVATFIITPEHEVIFWNKACEQLTGMKSSQLMLTKNHWSAFYEYERPCLVDIIIDGNMSALPKLYKEFGQSKLSPEGMRAEGWYSNLGGHDRYIIFEAVPIFNMTGKLVAAIETLQDVTEIKKETSEKEHIIKELQKSFAKNTTLKGFIPICSSCKDIRDKEGSWIPPEEYFLKESKLQFSHGICPKCVHKLYPGFSEKFKK